MAGTQFKLKSNSSGTAPPPGTPLFSTDELIQELQEEAEQVAQEEYTFEQFLKVLEANGLFSKGILSTLEKAQKTLEQLNTELIDVDKITRDIENVQLLNRSPNIQNKKLTDKKNERLQKAKTAQEKLHELFRIKIALSSEFNREHNTWQALRGSLLQQRENVTKIIETCNEDKSRQSIQGDRLGEIVREELELEEDLQRSEQIIALINSIIVGRTEEWNKELQKTLADVADFVRLVQENPPSYEELRRIFENDKRLIDNTLVKENAIIKDLSNGILDLKNKHEGIARRESTLKKMARWLVNTAARKTP